MRAPMLLGKEKIIPIIAMIVLLIGITSTIYVHATQNNKDTIKIIGEEYTIDQIFSLADTRTIKTDDGYKTGVALDDLILKIGVGCPTCHTYTFKGKDTYQNTVSWEYMEKGVLTNYSKIYFPDIAHSYWVHDIIEIEVK